MKIGIVTITNGGLNYGNRLQNYALQKTLQKHNMKVETINNQFVSKKIKYKIKEILLKIYRNVNSDKREKGVLFKKFNNDYVILTKKLYSYNQIEKFTKKNQYDFLISGSDQVWNSNFSFNSEIEYLTFIPKEKRLTYAASFGVSELTDNEGAKIKPLLAELVNISVREDAGKQICENLTTRQDVTVNLDPTMLLNQNEWEKVECKPAFSTEKPYIFKYFLGNDSIDSVLEKFAKENEIIIIDVKELGKFIGPAEFLYLINHAALVLTDSFHGNVFSIIFNTPFFVFERKDQNKSMNSRIETLLTKFHLEDRLITPEKLNINGMSFDKTNAILKDERKKSADYLMGFIK